MRLDVARHSSGIPCRCHGERGFSKRVPSALRILVRDLLSIAKRERTEVSRTSGRRGVVKISILEIVMA